MNDQAASGEISEPMATVLPRPSVASLITRPAAGPVTLPG